MTPQRPLRLLHISDLHFGSTGIPEWVGGQPTGGAQARVSQAIGADESRRFLEALPGFLRNKYGSQEHWPKLVIVNGDLIDSGTETQSDGTRQAFDEANDFLSQLANTLDISKHKVFVVPGNHDVDWSLDPETQQKERFRNYHKAVGHCRTPGFRGDDPEPLKVDLSDILDDVNVELFLLVSPTFSGVPEQESDELLVEHLSPLNRHLKDSRCLQTEDDASVESLERLISEAMTRGKRKLDIGAIGQQQRSWLSEQMDHTRSDHIRIAVLHHHLLPDPQLDVRPFDAIIDAGRLLDQLISYKFDLVLTGHKHNRRLVRYRRGEAEIDMFSAPSLFQGNANSPSGFAVIDIWGADAPHYAHLQSFRTGDFEPDGSGSPALLLRSGRVIPKIGEVSAGISARNQVKVVPLLESMRDAFAWTEDHFASELSDRVWRQISKDLENLGAQKLVLRPPQLPDRWDHLIERIASEEPGCEMRFVGENELEFWLKMEVEWSPAHTLEKPLKNVDGLKRRIMIIDRTVLRDRNLAKSFARVVRMMVKRYEVYVVPRDGVHQGIDTNFSILGSLAVTWPDGYGSRARGLTVSFDGSEREKAERNWRVLLAEKVWGSTGRADIVAWLNSNYEHGLSDEELDAG